MSDKKYEYVTITLKTGVFSVAADDFKKIIKQYAAKGYRFVDFIPTKQVGYEMIKEGSLVFEKPAMF
ncbi:DUF4177 domain-containing protein [Mycoplasmatota bacterium zrk1]